MRLCFVFFSFSFCSSIFLKHLLHKTLCSIKLLQTSLKKEETTAVQTLNESRKLIRQWNSRWREGEKIKRRNTKRERERERAKRKKKKQDRRTVFVIGYMISALRRQWHSTPSSRPSNNNISEERSLIFFSVLLCDDPVALRKNNNTNSIQSRNINRNELSYIRQLW